MARQRTEKERSNVLGVSFGLHRQDQHPPPSSPRAFLSGATYHKAQCDNLSLLPSLPFPFSLSFSFSFASSLFFLSFFPTSLFSQLSVLYCQTFSATARLMSALSSFYGPSLTLDTQRPPLLGRRRFSSACKIAQITFMGYPPKIQPQASALRGERRRSQAPNSIKTDNLVSLDAVDEEAGCILLALSNHKYENVESLPKVICSIK